MMLNSSDESTTTTASFFFIRCIHLRSSFIDPVMPTNVVASESHKKTKKPLEFWLVFLGTSVAVFLSALELTSVGTALPTIVEDLDGAGFIWIGSAYSLASSALMPASGGLSNIFGRRAVMMGSIALFAVGAAVAGSARSIHILIIGRAIQGAGGGSIISMSQIIIADLVTLRERGKFAGIIGAVWALASVLGPPIGGALASTGHWRWLFYLNLPLSAVAAVLVFIFLRMKTPEGSAMEKLGKIDWIGNLLIVGSTASIILALTWGGVQYPWTSAHVVVPLVVGSIGIAVFLVYEFTLAKHPIVPIRLFGNRTTMSGYTIVFFHGVAMTLVVYYLPTYFQGAKGASAIRSGILLFPTAVVIAPIAIITGQTIERTGHYRTQHYIGAALMMVGYGTMSILTAKSTIAMAEGLQIVGAIGFGMLYVGPNFAILAPLAVEDNAHALALMAYIRTFGQ
ncbi:MFS general substrate transporter [Clavulina sp. PMI_390]|nr:MFS general substrate transporter [Clavulina sp. PMI_390]